jgi:AcrR family transcriptional regulator
MTGMGARFLSGSERDRLIEAAAELCAEEGYEGLAEEAIAERAQVPVQTLATIFPGGKEECVLAAENVTLFELVTAVSNSYSADRSEWESVVYGVKAILEAMAAAPAFAYMGYVVSRQMSDSSELREINKSGHRMIEAMLERGWEYSRNDLQPATTALGVLGGAQALVRRELAAGRGSELPRILPDCVYIATVPFLGQEEALRLARRGRELLE